ncbi:uncharacterized protein [Diadema antillarum]|uniref:uncharacterized protein n=1 Tax=Diadema antillarum TaxID=105358 RepID=UPI003A8B2790
MPDRAGGGWHSHPVHSEAYAIIPGDIYVAATGNAFIHSVELLGGRSNNEGRVVFTIRNNPTSLRLAHHEEWMKNASILICRYLGFKGVYGTVGGDSFGGSSRDVYAKMGVVFCPPDATNITDCWMEEEREYGGRKQSIGIVCCDESGAIPDSRITGYTGYTRPFYGRLNGPGSYRIPSTGSRDITITLDAKYLVTGVITQGRAGANEFVTSYYVESSTDDVWTTYADIDTGSNKIFSANYDDSSAVTHHFQRPVIASTVKVEIRTYFSSSYISLRMELLGYGPLPESIGAFEVEPCLPTNSGDKLGVQDGSIPDSNLTASSALSSSYTAPYGRIGSSSAWIPANGDNDMWVKIFPTNYDYGYEDPETCPHLTKPPCPIMLAEDGTAIQYIAKPTPSSQATFMSLPQGVDAFIHSVELLGGRSNNEGRVVFTIRNNPTSLRLAHHEEWMKNASILICRYLGFKGVYGTVGGDSFGGSSRDVYAKMGVVFCPPDATNITDCWMEEEREYGGRDQSIGIVCCDGNSRVSVGSPLGLESGAIPNSWITGYIYSGYSAPYYGRLNGPSSYRESAGGSRYMSITLGAKHLVTGVITQGRAGTNEFVTSYYVVSYNDGVRTTYVDIDTGSTKTFSANYDDSSAVTHHFQSPVIADTVEIYISTYVSSYISLRMELLGYGPLPENIGALEVEPCLPTDSGEKLGVQDGSIPDSNLTASSALSSSYTAPSGRLASNSGWLPANGDNDIWVKIFPTNNDYNTMVTTPFPVPIRASYVRIHPVAWEGLTTMRYEVLGYQ